METQGTKKQQVFVKTAHLFAHRKSGAQKRFEKMYDELAEKVRSAWTTDLIQIEGELKQTSKYNAALASTKRERLAKMAEQTARETLATVFKEWRVEINRIVSDLAGYPQEDGNVLFPDGSVARMPKGLFIPPDRLLKFNI